MLFSNPAVEGFLWQMPWRQMQELTHTQTADIPKHLFQHGFPFVRWERLKGRYLVPKVVCSSVHNPDTKKMVQMSWLLATLLSFMQSGSARIRGIAMMPPNARM